MVPRQMALTMTPLRPSSRYSIAPTSILVARLLGDRFEIPPVIGVLQGRRDPQQLLGVDEAAAIGGAKPEHGLDEIRSERAIRQSSASHRSRPCRRRCRPRR